MPIVGATELQPFNALEQYMRGLGVRQEREAAAQTSQLNALKLQAEERAMSERAALQNALASGADDNALLRLPGGLDVVKQRVDLSESQSKASAAQTKAVADRMEYWKRMVPNNPAQAAAWVAAAYSDPLVGPELSKLGTAEQVVAGIPQDPAGYARWSEGVSMFADKLAERRTLTEADIQRLRREDQRIGIDRSRLGLESQRVGLEGQRVGLEGRRVAVAEERAARERATTAAAAETAPVIDPKIKAKREALFPKAQASVVRVERDIDEQIRRVRQLRNHPGLAGITGGVEGRIPSFSDKSTAAQSLLDNILAKGTLSSLTELRAASETGGALGNVSNQDTALLQNSVGALSQTQGKPSFQAALDDYIRDLEFAKQNARNAFDETYSYRNAPATKPPAADDWSDL